MVHLLRSLRTHERHTWLLEHSWLTVSSEVHGHVGVELWWLSVELGVGGPHHTVGCLHKIVGLHVSGVVRSTVMGSLVLVVMVGA